MTDDDLVTTLRTIADIGTDATMAALLREAADRIAAIPQRPDIAPQPWFWGQRVKHRNGATAMVRGWDRNHERLYLEFPSETPPVATHADGWTATE